MAESKLPTGKIISGLFCREHPTEPLVTIVLEGRTDAVISVPAMQFGRFVTDLFAALEAIRARASSAETPADLEIKPGNAPNTRRVVLPMGTSTSEYEMSDIALRRFAEKILELIPATKLN